MGIELLVEYLLAACFIVVNTSVAANVPIHEGNLKKYLTKNEWNRFIGNDGQNFTIVSLSHKVLRKGNNQSEKNDQRLELQIEAPKFGKTFNLELQRSPKIISSDFILLETYTNGSVFLKLNEEDFNCFFRGSNTALNLCYGVDGIMHFDNSHYYIIQPLPKRFHNRKYILHLLTRKSFINYEKKGYYKLKHSLDKSAIENASESKNMEYLYENFDSLDNPFGRKDSSYYRDSEFERKRNRTEYLKRVKREISPVKPNVFVETAVFIDRDLFEHMKTNFPENTEKEIIRFVLAMINAVQLIYHDPSLGRPINFVLKRLEIMKEEVSGLVRTPDIDRFLSNFCNWQKTKNPVEDKEPLHWDHALILTGLDLYVRGKHGKISNQVVGLAPVAGMCTTTSSCTVNEGRHFESVYVVAHEIGHNLGMRHDGPIADNNCDPSSYIMSPTLGSGKITWSSCSRKYIQEFLKCGCSTCFAFTANYGLISGFLRPAPLHFDLIYFHSISGDQIISSSYEYAQSFRTPQSKCLLDHGSSAGNFDHEAEGTFPGERFNADQQCMLKYGIGSKHSSQQSLEDICRDMHCERNRYSWTSHPALEGTKCGINMWCRGGRCTPRIINPKQDSSNAFKQVSELENVNIGWTDWRPSECSSGCLSDEKGLLTSGSTGIITLERFCNNRDTQGNRQSCAGTEKKYQTCIAQQCINIPKLTIGEFAEKMCTRAKEFDKDLTGFGLQKNSSDPQEACLVWCQKHNGETKTTRWTFPEGTACQIRGNNYGRTSFCIDGRCEVFLCDASDRVVFSQMPDRCQNTYNNEIVLKTGLRRESTNHWKSASRCYYNCISPGFGIRLVMNKKIGKSTIQLCQPNHLRCRNIKTIFEHASMICSKYKKKVRRLSGLGMQVFPSAEDPDRPCRVACQDEHISHRFYLVNGDNGWFPFGTHCSHGSTDRKTYCISGKCLSFGSDGTPLSENKFTLPLLSRTKRSNGQNNSKVFFIREQKELDAIVNRFISILSGLTDSSTQLFDVDYNNPIHIQFDDHYGYAANRSVMNNQ